MQELNKFRITERDELGQAHNGENTYRYISAVLKSGKSCLLTWANPRKKVSLVMLFTLLPVVPKDNLLRLGINSTDLFVSVMGKGAWSFRLEGTNINKNYLAEKLGLRYAGIENDLFNLINGIRNNIKGQLEG